MDVRKIREIYNCDYITSNEELYPLQKWYNQLIDKKIIDISVADILRMIRQDEFMDIAIPKAISFLRENVFLGETYDGEMLEKLSSVEKSNMTPYIADLRKILEQALIEMEKYDWICDEEKEEFEEVVNKLKQKIS